ncbi:DUF2510 domain-containing protein [Nocardia sp. NPDC052112]|uniref:DUF2510 domain-containing protein n=1 Tax=Nocardia sp. NPDC052112 TaxID=3155646 RepID=UPI003430DF12
MAGDGLLVYSALLARSDRRRAVANRGADHADVSTTDDLAAPTAPPGWYPSLNDPARQQWWDGQGWTEQVSGSE